MWPLSLSLSLSKVLGVVGQVAALLIKQPSASNGFVPPLSKTRCVKPHRFANTVPGKSAEARPLKHTAALEGGLK